VKAGPAKEAIETYAVAVRNGRVFIRVDPRRLDAST